MANRVSVYFESEEVGQAVREITDQLRRELAVRVQAGLIVRLGAKLASRVRVDLQLMTDKIELTPASAGKEIDRE